MPVVRLRWLDWIPRDPELWASLMIAVIAGLTLLAYRRLDRHQSARRYLTRKDRSGVLVGLLTASLVVLTAATVLSMRYVIDTCLAAAAGAVFNKATKKNKKNAQRARRG